MSGEMDLVQVVGLSAKGKYIKEELDGWWSDLGDGCWMDEVYWSKEGCVKFYLELGEESCSLSCSGMAYTDQNPTQGGFSAEFKRISYENATNNLIEYMRRLFEVYELAGKNLKGDK